MSFTAQWPGQCSACDEPIKIGQSIETTPFSTGEYQHTRCPVAQVKPVCSTCWLEKPCECEE